MNSKITKHYTIWEEDQIIIIDFHIPTNIHLPLVQNLLQHIIELNNGKACALLIDLDHVTGAHPAALNQLFQGIDQSGVMSIGLIAKQEASGILGRVIYSVHKGYTPMRVFNRILDANRWIMTYSILRYEK